MAKVLVTGGAGFIGSHLCDRLVERGHEVVVLDDFSLGREENLRQVAGRVRIVRSSVLDIAQHAKALEGVTLIYHLAALISSHDSLKTPDEYTHVNLGGLLRLLDVARPLTPRPKIVFASSSTVYGIRAEPTCRETDVPAPANVYALTKLAGEHLLSMYQERDGYEFCCLRLFNVYGPRQNPHHPYANVTCKFAHAAAGDRKVKLYGTGENTRDFVFIDDVVAAFLRAAEPTPSRLYNVGTGRDASIQSLLATVEQVSGVKLEVERLPAWSNDIKAIRADVSRAANELKIEARVGLSDGLAQTVEYFRKNPR
ncbi:MAG: NAD-dependent epimerase/dehydratase family protein [Myxococcales bacterium]|nr:NAD-dependent epimerase/dehydratase family protein [Myxococcales bacterium]